MLLLRIKFSLVILIVCLQLSAAAKKRKPTSLQKAVSTVSTFLSDVKSVFQDFIDVMSDFLGGVDDDKDDASGDDTKKLDWGDRISKYTEDTVSLGYKLLTDLIPILDVARSSVDDAVPLLPNVTVSRFIQSLLRTLVPDLVGVHRNKQNEQKYNYADT